MFKRGVSIFAAAALAASLSFAGDGGENGGKKWYERDNDHLYIGLGIAAMRVYSTESSWFDEVESQDRVGNLRGTLGYYYNKYFAIEGHIGQSILEEDYSDDFYWSLFFKPSYPLNDDETFFVYGLLGYGKVRVKGEDGNAPAYNVGKTIVDEGQFQYGLGMEYKFDEDWRVFADYTWLMNDEDIEPQRLYWYDPKLYDELSVDAFTIGIIYDF